MLYEKIKEYAESGVYPMHMPGHKRNTALLPPGIPYGADITEISGFDDLHDPRGVLRDTAELAAELYGSDKAFLLINGSTVGILAAVGAHAGRGETVLIAGKCHRSVYNAAELFGLKTVNIEPDIDEASGIPCSIDPSVIESVLEKNRDVKAVFVTSPTYEGVISDISSIACIAHNRGIPLLVDEAHGAHLGFSKLFPGEAVKAGADVTVMSLHKTLPALTQCSLLHVRGGIASAEKTAGLLSTLQTSSPSYVLLASIDRCLRILAADKDRLFRDYERELGMFDGAIASLKRLFVLCHGSDRPHPGFFAFDPGKLVICTKNTAMSGETLADTLRVEYKIEPELARPGCVVAMTSVCDRNEGFTRLANALLSIDGSL